MTMEKKSLSKIQRLVKIVDKLQSENDELNQKLSEYKSNDRTDNLWWILVIVCKNKFMIFQRRPTIKVQCKINSLAIKILCDKILILIQWASIVFWLKEHTFL